MQLFLLGYIVIEICEIFTVGAFPLHDNVRQVDPHAFRVDRVIDR